MGSGSSWRSKAQPAGRAPPRERDPPRLTSPRQATPRGASRQSTVRRRRRRARWIGQSCAFGVERVPGAPTGRVEVHPRPSKTPEGRPRALPPTCPPRRRWPSPSRCHRDRDLRAGPSTIAEHSSRRRRPESGRPREEPHRVARSGAVAHGRTTAPCRQRPAQAAPRLQPERPRGRCPPWPPPRRDFRAVVERSVRPLAPWRVPTRTKSGRGPPCRVRTAHQ